MGGTDNASVAANNLAFIYAEEGTNWDEALNLATAAKQRLPNDASVDDTIGGIHYKNGLADLAIKSFQESLKKRPDDAEELCHHGLAYAKLGDKARARQALQRALTKSWNRRRRSSSRAGVGVELEASNLGAEMRRPCRRSLQLDCRKHLQFRYYERCTTELLEDTALKAMPFQNS